MTTQRRHSEAGFTMIEVMIAVLLTAIAVIGIVGLYRVQARSSSYSRRSTEAAVLAADKMEELRTTISPTSSLADEDVDAQGRSSPAAPGPTPYTRRWFVTSTPSAPATPTQHRLEVEVVWDDDGTARTIELFSIRGI